MMYVGSSAVRSHQRRLFHCACEFVPSSGIGTPTNRDGPFHRRIGTGRMSLPPHDRAGRRRRPMSAMSPSRPSCENDNERRDGSRPMKLRGPTLDDVSHFRSMLSKSDSGGLITTLFDGGANPSDGEAGGDGLDRYNVDWTGRYRGNSTLVLKPSNTTEVSSILRYCHDNRIGVVPHGGNTGLCGGATPMRDEMILSLENMDNIYGLDGYSGILVCDSGAILENLHTYANGMGHLFPLDIGSKGTCQIGGNVSTNAGGHYFFRYGSLHGNVIGMEVVLPDGRVLRLNMNGVDDDDDGTIDGTNGIVVHRKDNTGYDLKHIFIGAEGTIGVITKVAIACPALPTSRNATLLVCDSYSDVLGVMATAKSELGEILSAMELMDHNTLRLVQAHGSGGNDGGGSRLLRDMLQADITEQKSDRHSHLYLLVETQGSNSEDDASKMDNFLSRLYDEGTIRNGYLAQDTRQISEMWSIRESCNPCVSRAGCVYKFDVSVPIEDYVTIARGVEGRLSASMEHEDIIVCLWGHVNDGNAHINIVTPGRFEKEADIEGTIEKIVFDEVLKHGGSISAEHGIGQKKNEVLGRLKGEHVMNIMAQIKALFDPHGIMNPGKYLPKK